MNSAMITEPPGPQKRQLILDYMRLTGLQREVDEGTFLSRFVMPGSRLWNRLPESVTYLESFEELNRIIKEAYSELRDAWQEEYEAHINWEFNEEELRTIVGFFASSPGQHFLEGDVRMRAYVSTNTEDRLDQIIEDAFSLFAARRAAGPTGET